MRIFSELELIMLECAAACLIAGAGGVFMAFAFTGNWGPLLASSGTGLGFGICVLGLLTAASCFSKLAEYQDTTTTVVRHLNENASRASDSARHWQAVALSATRLSEVSGGISSSHH